MKDGNADSKRPQAQRIISIAAGLEANRILWKPPQIEVTLPHDALVQQTESVVRDYLGSTPPHFFSRGGRSVVLGENDAGNLEARQCVKPDITLLAGHVARWGTWDTRDGKRWFKECHPQSAAVSHLLAAGRDVFPRLKGISRTPTLRPDGSILAEPGYDRSTSLYLACPADVCRGLRVPDNPSASDLQNAYAWIWEIFRDFPFANQASFANSVGAMLTVFYRHLIDGCTPLFPTGANAAGSGKGLLVRAILQASGVQAAYLPDPTSSDELRKGLTSALLAATQVLILDDVTQPISAPSLATFLTSTIWNDRRLALNVMVSIPNHIVMFALGNQLSIGGDISRRSVMIEMEAATAKPFEGRTFAHPDLIQWMRTNQAAIVSAILTIGRGWFAAGRPAGPERPLGSFEEWTRIVGGMLAVTGIPGFLTNRDRPFELAGTELEPMQECLGVLHGLFSTNPFTAAHLADCSVLRLDSILPGLAFQERTQLGHRQAIGRSLNRLAGRRFDGFNLRLVRLPKSGNVARYQIVVEGPERT